MQLRDPRSSILDPRSSILDPRSSILDPRSSILDPRSSILDPRGCWILARYDILLLVVEGYALAGLNRLDRHAERGGMVVGRVDVAVRLLVAVADALHPVFHVSHRLLIHSGVGRRLERAALVR